MQGNWNHGAAHYRCRYPSEYAIAKKIDHVPSVYLREDAVMGDVDAWLATTFSPGRIAASLEMLERAQSDIAPSMDNARRALAECDRKLARHRAALEAGADPVLVAEWTRDVQREREIVANQIAGAKERAAVTRKLDSAEVKQLVDDLGDLLEILQGADAGEKCEIYRDLGLRLTYNKKTRAAAVEAQPRPPVGVLSVSGGGLEPPRPLIGH
jgi:site-specific DNA recombinase